MSLNKLLFPLVSLLILPFATLSPLSGSESGSAPLHIMLTNDDGIDAPGIKAVETALKGAGHKVTVVAPATQQSGASSSITGGRIQLSPRGENRWAIEGRPVDAARIGLGYLLLNDPPDLVISGANLGQNAGPDTILSGTVGAALAAQRAGIPAIALSVEVNFKEAREKPRFQSSLKAMDNAAMFLTELIAKPGIVELAKETVINLNYPAREARDVKGIRLANLSEQSLASRHYQRIDDSTLEPRFQPIDAEVAENDAKLLAQGYITVTFLKSHLEVGARDNKRFSKKFNVDTLE